MGLPAVPTQFLRSASAPPERTLVDILRHTATTHPEAAAIDDGTTVITYSELMDTLDAAVADLYEQGIRRGDRIGIRLPSGSHELYIAILSVLAAGAAYVPVDVDDPDERATLVFGEADVTATITSAGLDLRRTRSRGDAGPPLPHDDAWIIFTSGSTGTPKGVAVTHRSAAAFVDAEATLFCQDSPLGPDDRVLAGLSIAFDASCEEMWLAWRHGACLVPAPRSLVRSGMDLGPWLIRRNITVVSTVPTLASLWPTEALDQVRLLIFGGEACPQELVQRVSAQDREVWNTYGPTEATVVSCAAPLQPGEAVSIGLPLPGWDLAVVDTHGNPVEFGQTGELVIGGVGLARYLDADKDRTTYAPLPALGWKRAYRSGDHVRLAEDGLYFVGRVDDQVKIGGRRIELGEVEAAVSGLTGVHSATVVVRETPGGDKILVAYLTLDTPHPDFENIATAQLADLMPRALIPRLCVLDELPVTTSGKVDKKALPWPLPGANVQAEGLTPTEDWLAQLWVDVLGTAVTERDADFFALGGTSLAAATLVGRVRDRMPTVSVRDLYDHPRLGAFAEHIDTIASTLSPSTTRIDASTPDPSPVGMRTRVAQETIQLLVMGMQAATRWVPWLLVINACAAHLGYAWAHPVSVPWWLLLLVVLVFLTPLGRLPLSALAARVLTAGITPGDYPRGGATHLRLWAAERLSDTLGGRDVSSATWVLYYARLLGVQVGSGVNLHSLPPVTGLLTLGDHCSVEPEVDLSGYWLEGDTLHVGAIYIGHGARIGARSVLLPGTRVGNNAHVEAGSCVTGRKKVKDQARWSGSPAAKVGRARHRFPTDPPPRATYWVPIFGLTSLLLSALPLVPVAAGSASISGARSFLQLVALTPLGVLVAMATYAGLTWLLVRLLAIGLRPGITPVRSRRGWQAWATQHLMDDARRHLFPLYAALLTPLWLRSLGAQVGRNVEISTAVMIPRFTVVRDGAFLADDTMVGGYELGGGWMLTGVSKIGKRSFLGNSGMTGPTRKLSKNSLVAVLSSTPKKSQSGSNWWGSPPERLRRVVVQSAAGESSTYEPGWRVKAARGCVETVRLCAPMTSAVLGVCVLGALQWVYVRHGLGWTILSGGPLLMAAGACAAAITVAMKWICVGRIRAGSHPLWSRFVWLNELQDTFIEVVAAPWLLNHVAGSSAMNVFLRFLGARIGRGAWLESYWLPEADLCRIGVGATIGRGCVVQTHLFQDRVMSLDQVRIDAAATLAPHSVALPGSVLGTGAVVGPSSLVMRGDHVPSATRWQGNPIEIWG